MPSSTSYVSPEAAVPGVLQLGPRNWARAHDGAERERAVLPTSPTGGAPKVPLAVVATAVKGVPGHSAVQAIATLMRDCAATFSEASYAYDHVEVAPAPPAATRPDPRPFYTRPLGVR